MIWGDLELGGAALEGRDFRNFQYYLSLMNLVL